MLIFALLWCVILCPLSMYHVYCFAHFCSMLSLCLCACRLYIHWYIHVLFCMFFFCSMSLLFVSDVSCVFCALYNIFFLWHSVLFCVHIPYLVHCSGCLWYVMCINIFMFLSFFVCSVFLFSMSDDPNWCLFIYVIYYSCIIVLFGILFEKKRPTRPHLKLENYIVLW